MSVDFRKYKINFQITAKEVRLLDEFSKQIGIVTLEEARQKARENGQDLVEIVSKSNPPIVKMISFSKFKYQESKKDKQQRKGDKGGELKELQFSPFIGEADLETRIKKAQGYLTDGNKVKISIKFQGRQITKVEFGHQLVDKIKVSLAEYAQAEGEPKLLGKRLFLTLTPNKKSKK